MTKDEAYDILVNYGVATEDEVELVTNINGYNPQALLDILYVRTGNRSFDQWANENDLTDDFSDTGIDLTEIEYY